MWWKKCVLELQPGRERSRIGQHKVRLKQTTGEAPNLRPLSSCSAASGFVNRLLVSQFSLSIASTIPNRLSIESSSIEEWVVPSIWRGGDSLVSISTSLPNLLRLAIKMLQIKILRNSCIDLCFQSEVSCSRMQLQLKTGVGHLLR
jgi:hypothetical protein